MQNRDLTRNDTQTEIKRETISQLAHRHLLDKNHTTTDEELRNVQIEFNDSFDASIEELSKISAIDNNTLLPPLPFEKAIDTINQDTDINTVKNSIPNPYNVLK